MPLCRFPAISLQTVPIPKIKVKVRRNDLLHGDDHLLAYDTIACGIRTILTVISNKEQPPPRLTRQDLEVLARLAYGGD